jgi:hypothetical protein
MTIKAMWDSRTTKGRRAHWSVLVSLEICCKIQPTQVKTDTRKIKKKGKISTWSVPLPK